MRGKFNAKALALFLALMLTVGGVIGGTVAWLIASPAPVVNTFTYGDINIELEESDTGLDGDSDTTTNEYKMMPGEKITKDPVITIKQGSEKMWLFVKLEKSNNFDSFLTYEVADGWTALAGEEGVYYTEVAAETVETTDKEFRVIKNDTVTVKETVTKEMLNALDANGASNFPTLTVTAYAVQHIGNPTVTDAWAKVTAAANP